MALIALLPALATAVRFVGLIGAGAVRARAPISGALHSATKTSAFPADVAMVSSAIAVTALSSNHLSRSAPSGSSRFSARLQENSAFTPHAPMRQHSGGYQSHPSGPTWHVGSDAENRSVTVEEYLPAERPSTVLHGGEKIDVAMSPEGFSPLSQSIQEFLLLKKKDESAPVKPGSNAAESSMEDLMTRWYEVRDSKLKQNAMPQNAAPTTSSQSQTQPLVLPLGRKAGHQYAGRVFEGGSKQTFEGHGAYFPPLGMTVVPPGVRITTANPGFSINTRVTTRMASGDWMELAELAAQDVRIAEQTEGMVTWLSGTEIPNFLLDTPGANAVSNALPIHENSTTVGHRMPLSRLLAPYMGSIVWASCVNFSDSVSRLLSPLPVKPAAKKTGK